jgi:hypothetical protein
MNVEINIKIPDAILRLLYVLSTIYPMVSATKTFKNNPSPISLNPYTVLSYDNTVSLFSCIKRCFDLSIGPATSWGKKDKNKA